MSTPLVISSFWLNPIRRDYFIVNWYSKANNHRKAEKKAGK